jgi:4-alpha-glucanotransferase
MEHNLTLFDLIRVDHFRGLVAYWEVPAGEENAMNGQWVKAPVDDFFQKIFERVPKSAIIAEDLGYITPDVIEVMKRFGLPGMKILLFAFNDDPATNPYAPHNHVPHCVVYTGTHDNNTVRGWFETELSVEMKNKLFGYLGREVAGDMIHLEFVRLAMMSVAEMIIIPLQDLLGLDQATRMNLPASRTGNWQWRLVPNQLDGAVRRLLLEMTEIYGRTVDLP